MREPSATAAEHGGRGVDRDRRGGNQAGLRGGLTVGVIAGTAAAPGAALAAVIGLSSLFITGIGFAHLLFRLGSSDTPRVPRVLHEASPPALQRLVKGRIECSNASGNLLVSHWPSVAASARSMRSPPRPSRWARST
ncbi:hypothetical protein CBM2599_A120089 [Cupriavidus taiwanensis]|nr:hypothetical protein CBM2599_A120089 [Cupriavidus taiwanensis]SOY81497.1 hypothetical protein CBM2600_A120115 [Cupriavidus taiwanensis]